MFQIKGTLPSLMTMPAMGQEALPTVRDGEIVYVDGKPVSRNGTKTITYAALAPLTGRDLMLVPEGDRTTAQYWLFQPLDDDDVVPLEVEDKVLYMGKAHQVQDSKMWGSYVQARISEIDVGADAVDWPDADADTQ